MKKGIDYSGMDAKIERHRLLSKRCIGIGLCAVFAIIVGLWLVFREKGASMNVDRAGLTIATVERGKFNDYVRVVGQVVPDRIVYLDAVESGRVEERLIEEGAMVEADDVILRLSNPVLNIGILESEANLAYQENELRNTRLTMEQEHLRLKQERIGLSKELNRSKRRYEHNTLLYGKGIISHEEFLQAEEDYMSASKQMEVLEERIRQDQRLRDNQLKSLNENIRNIKESLTLVRQRLENLKVKAPVSGQLGNLEAQIGQSIAQGERIGQVLTSRLKVEAKVDEHYVERVVAGLTANFESDGKRYALRLTKVYPEVQGGQFRTDLHFAASRPQNIRSGQTLHLDLQLGDPVQAVIIPRGNFYQASGGQYVYVLDKDGTKARRWRVRLGRQNPLFYEVVEGLSPGERVIISGYDLFGDNECLILQ